jgi:hypothetical protein
LKIELNMKKFLKQIVASLIGLALIGTVVHAGPGTGSQSCGLTNALLTPGVTYTNTSFAAYYGSSLSNLTCGNMSCNFNRNGLLTFSGQIACSNQHTITVKLYPINANNQLADPNSQPPVLTWAFTPPLGTGTPGTLVTNNFVAVTNLDTVSYSALTPITIADSAATGSGGGVLAPSLTIDVKNAYFPQ